MTDPALPSLALDGLEAVVFDTDGVLTDTASVHAAAWKRLFDNNLTLLTARGQEPPRPYEESDYLRSIDGRPRYDGVAGFLASRGIQLPWGDPSDPPDRETVCGLGNAKDRSFVAHLRDHGATPFPSSVAFVRRVRERGLRTAVVSASRNMAGRAQLRRPLPRQLGHQPAPDPGPPTGPRARLLRHRSPDRRQGRGRGAGPGQHPRVRLPRRPRSE